MHVEHLWLKDFRNYSSADLQPSEGLNIFVGANAHGKTNLLEAIYFLSTLRPLRLARDADLIRWEAEEARIGLEFTRDGISNQLAIRLSLKGKRVLQINEQIVPRSTDFIGRLAAVCFTSNDLLLTKGEPADRRRFLDNEIGMLSHRYLYSLIHYRRCLEHRNNLLRSYLEGHGSLETLEEWNTQLVRYGSRLFHARSMFIQDLNQKVSPIHAEISGGEEQLRLDPLPGLPLKEYPQQEEEWACFFTEALQKSHQEELGRGTTVVGPHRDDFAVMINDKDARLFASQGQQRTAALSLKLAEIKLYEDRLGESPVVLLDDVFSDLDPERRQYLMQFLHLRCQTFITCTDLSSFSDKILQEARIFRIYQGQVLLYETT